MGLKGLGSLYKVIFRGLQMTIEPLLFSQHSHQSNRMQTLFDSCGYLQYSLFYWINFAVYFYFSAV